MPTTAVIGTPISSLPFTVNECGYYFLTGCLTGVTGQDGILVMADDVTIDLNGFALVGVPGSGHGISVPSAQQSLSVYGGTIKEWGLFGVSAANASGGRFTELMISENGSGSVGGMDVGDNSEVRSCRVLNNQRPGIAAADHCLIQGCLVEGNGENGIQVGSDCYILDNTCVSNGQVVGNGAGINLGTSVGCRVEGNNVSRTDFGINANSGGPNLIIRNSAHANSTNYNLPAGNDVGPIGSARTATSPWANISY